MLSRGASNTIAQREEMLGKAMNKSGFFLCGVLVGVVISAAFGLDLMGVFEFDSNQDSQRRTTTAAPTVPEVDAGELQAVRAELGQLKRERDVAVEKLNSAAAQISELRADADEVRRLKLQDSSRTRQLAEVHDKASQLNQELERLKDESARKDQLVGRARADADTAQREVFDWLSGYYSTLRSEAELGLLLNYFKSSAPERFKTELVQRVLEANPAVGQRLLPIAQSVADSAAATSATSATAEDGAGEPTAATGPDSSTSAGNERSSSDAAKQ